MANYFGDAKANKFKGGYESDYLYGYDGNDELRGGWATDNIYGGTGRDILFGDQNDDYLYGEVGDDRLDGGSGNDRLQGGGGKDVVLGGAGDDVISLTAGTANGGAGIDTLDLDFAVATKAIKFTAPAAAATKSFSGISLTGFEKFTLDTGAGKDELIGGAFGDTFNSGDANDILKGRDGNDQLNAGAGNDAIEGGAGNDVIDTDAGNDTAAGGTGADSIYGDVGSDALSGGAGDDYLVGDGYYYGGEGATFDDTLRGGTGDDTLAGDTGADLLYGEDGDDVLRVANNSGAQLLPEKDLYDGGTGFDAVSFETGGYNLGAYIDLLDQKTNDGAAKFDTFKSIERVIGTSIEDSLFGSNSANDLEGGYGNDELRGRGGDDFLSGGAGSDTMTGGAGKDVFDLTDGTNPSIDHLDVITDFVAGTDKIQIDPVYFSEFDVLTVAVVSGATPVAAKEVATFLFDSDSHILAFDADGSGEDSDPFVMAILEGVSKLSLSNFVFVEPLI
jgi:Ca2+-binding RTX toxin-like protein